MFKVKEKKKKWFINKVEVRESTVHIGGHGVFATELIKKHEVFESSPVLTWHFSFLRDYQKLHDARHILDDHVFLWSNANVAFCLGYGTIYNHSNEPNAMHRAVHDDKWPRLEFIAKRDIQPGEEIFHHYSPKAGPLFFTETGTFDMDDQLHPLEKR